MNISRVCISSDHAALDEKAALISFFKDQEIEVHDFGTYTKDSCNYPDFVFPLVNSIHCKEYEYGILLCGTGIGVSMVANRFQGIRAALCRTALEAKMTRQHNDANVLCLGARINSLEELQEIISSFLSQTFEGGRHQKRLALFNDLGETHVPKK